MALKSIPGKKGQPREPRRRVECKRCTAFRGISVHAFLVEVKQGAEFDERGKIRHGRKLYVCAHCLMRGDWTQLG